MNLFTDAKRVLECLICKQRYSYDDIVRGNYQFTTMICSYCYREWQKAPHEIRCFGKPTFVRRGGKRLWGYNPLAEECNKWCPDKEVCKRIVKGES